MSKGIFASKINSFYLPFGTIERMGKKSVGVIAENKGGLREFKP